ncbi:hypothetical protein KP509_39G039900 [Ceratopteris richardii]|uniref:N-acetyltransferase domain-containing protein n=1 Tax=Ceratopteris richardii TaxID=49495 RepID=A0A8T2Q060_CERRI|nr:hypothetical protein KP509_39G039900 [Ceratopteris richardii]
MGEEKGHEATAMVPIRYVSYEGEEQLPLIMTLIDDELSEPYSIFTYRYFLTLWPQLCFMAFHEDTCVGTIVCKMGQHRNTFRGYIAMLVVIKPYRGRGIATELVTRSIQNMRDAGCEEVTLEAEVTNKGALALYGNLGFTRAKRLYKYYLNGVDAFRLKLLFPQPYDQRMLAEYGGPCQENEQGEHVCGHHHDHDKGEHTCHHFDPHHSHDVDIHGGWNHAHHVHSASCGHMHGHH